MPGLLIEAENISKEYNYTSIFQQLNGHFESDQSVAVLGDNGSGKSTLLQILSGMTEPTSGMVTWRYDDKKIPDYRWYEYLSYCSPHLYFDPRFTVDEIIRQFQRVKQFQNDLTHDDLIELMRFQPHRSKYINELSSGMNQRVRLVLTICADVPALFLDEPCSNLDQQGVDWYHELISTYGLGKLIFVASNDPREFDFCEKRLSLMDFKKH